jgi:AAA15 family ATPase/GTPase
MYIYAINIKNFRSFRDLWIFPNPDINVIVGPNNCGKTTILRALSFVLDPSVNYRQPGLLSRFDFYHSNTSLPIEILVWLRPAIGKDAEGREIYLENESVKLAFFDKLSRWSLEKSERNITGEIERHPVKLIAAPVDPMQIARNSSQSERLLAIRLLTTWNASVEATETEISIVDETFSELMPLGLRNKELLGFKFIGARRNPIYELSLARRSVLSKLIDEDEVTIALRELLLQLDGWKGQLLGKQSVNDLMRRLSRLIAPELMGALVSNLGTDFSLTFLGGDLWRLRGATAVATNMKGENEEGFSLPLEYQGDGAQNLVLIAHLIDLLKEQRENDIIVLEEPEQNLEPSLARWVFGELCSLTQNKTKKTGQIFITTHSPSLVGELKGADSLLIFSDNFNDAIPREKSSWRVLAARFLSPDSRKKLDQNHEQYVPALFARQALIVEGSSEMGFLPVAFRHLSNGNPGQNPYHLGLEIVNGENKQNAINHSRFLRAYGKKCHVLLDFDPNDGKKELDDCLSRFDGQVDFVTCWPNKHLLSFTKGCDLEVLLAHYVPTEILWGAIKKIYSDAGHPFIEEKWKEAKEKITEETIVEKLPKNFKSINLGEFDLTELETAEMQRAFLFALLHGPHECKSTKDMRMIAEYLAQEDEIPQIFDDLRMRVLLSMTSPEMIDHNAPHLAPR